MSLSACYSRLNAVFLIMFALSWVYRCSCRCRWKSCNLQCQKRTWQDGSSLTSTFCLIHTNSKTPISDGMTLSPRPFKVFTPCWTTCAPFVKVKWIKVKCSLTPLSFRDSVLLEFLSYPRRALDQYYDRLSNLTVQITFHGYNVQTSLKSNDKQVNMLLNFDWGSSWAENRRNVRVRNNFNIAKCWNTFPKLLMFNH